MTQVRPIQITVKSSRVRSSEEIPKTSQPTFSYLFRYEAIIGIIYVCLTIGLSIRFLFMMQKSTANDHYWSNFNVSGHQTFIGDLFNSNSIYLDSQKSLQLGFGVNDSVYGDYSQMNTIIKTLPARARSILLTSLPFEIAVKSLRNNAPDNGLKTMAPYCWLDFDRSFEMAHTAKRQARCLAKDSTNAAAYLESLLANIPYQMLVTAESFDFFNFSVLEALRSNSTHGQPWLKKLQNHKLLEVNAEVQRWRDAGMTTWITQLCNQFQQSVMDTMTITNSLGLAKKITVTNIPYAMAIGWTTKYAFYGYYADANICSIFLGCSLIRGASNFIEKLNIDWDSYVIVGPRLTPVNSLVRQTIGSYGAIDLRYVTPPQALINLFRAFQSFYISSLQDNSDAFVQYINLKIAKVDIVPPAWTNFDFYGGNPLCMFGRAKSYPQPSFSANDFCGGQDRYTIDLDRDSSVFAILATGSTFSDACTLSAQSTQACNQVLQTASSIYTSLSFGSKFDSMVQDAWSQALALNISYIQFAVSKASGNATFLNQPMLVSPSDRWSYFGWIAMYEWVLGKRETYTFEGDVSSVTTISPSMGYGKLAANPLELPQTASNYIWYITVYVSVVLFGVGILMLLFGLLIRFQMAGRKMLQFNRVIGSVWIGRPFLFLRGMTAVVILSTANVDFVSSGGFSRFKVTPRSFVDILLLAGETSWLTYCLNDICLPLTRQHSAIYSPISSVLSWLIVVVLEFTNPYIPAATVRSTCNVFFIDRQARCDVGFIAIGSSQRLGTICLIHVVCMVGSYVCVRVIASLGRWNKNMPCFMNHISIPAATQAFLLSNVSDELSLDKVSIVMSGLIPLTSSLFDVKLWMAIPSKVALENSYVFRRPIFKPQCSSNISSGNSTFSRVRIRLYTVVGLSYIAATVVASYVYLLLTESTMANDFWWAAFNSTGTQTFLADWYNKNLQTANNLAPLQIDHPKFGESQIPYNLTSTSILVSLLYPTRILNEVQTISNVIRGLRTMDGCMIPWIFTPYCYIDFNRTWELGANSKRQQHCATSEKSNGAVYLESIFRNAKWDKLNVCWGSALDVAFFNDLRTTSAGKLWITNTQANVLSIADETNYWLASGISSYQTQWQNFKRLGIIETFAVKNAFGVTYPLTLKRLNSSFQIPSQSSYKLYWGLANDLTAVLSNVSTIGGRSLIYGSSSYAYQNSTLEIVYAAVGELPTPLGPEMALMRKLLGPFGSIDVKRISCPESLGILHRLLVELTTNMLVSQKVSEFDFTSIPLAQQFSPQPSQWTVGLQKGGNIFCEFGTQSANQMLQFFSIKGNCAALELNTIYSNRQSVFRAILAANLLQPDAKTTSEICARELSQPAGCVKSISTSRNFLSAFNLPSFELEREKAIEDLKTSYQVSIAQFLKIGSDYNLSLVKLLDDHDPCYHIFSWLYLFDWVEGYREVINVSGQLGGFTSISGYLYPDQGPINAMEIPSNVAYYIRMAILYVTMLLFLISCFTVCMILAGRGYAEMWILFNFNRVCGAVWIGRPLVLLRGVTALCLLSTARLELVQSSNSLVSYLTSPPQFWVTTLMSCSEVTWLVYIINDIASPLSKQYTSKYAYKSSILTWIISGVWSIAKPARHQVTIARKCVVDAVDFQLVCQSGELEIGSIDRIGALVLIAITCCVVCYVFERVVYPDTSCNASQNSLFLHAVSKGLNYRHWRYCGVYYLDKASALLNGLVSLQIKSWLYIFDIKSWRAYAIDLNDIHGNDRPPDAFWHAIPLVE